MSAEMAVIKELADVLRLLADKDGRFHNWESGEGEVLDDKLNQALALRDEHKQLEMLNQFGVRQTTIPLGKLKHLLKQI